MSHLNNIPNPFHFDHFDVRTATDKNQNVWFCAKDICDVLDITWKGTSATLGNMPKNWFMVWNLQTIKGERAAGFINEPGLYRLIFRSNKPLAIEFSNWVCEVVLPELRKNGSFGKIDIKTEIAIDKRIDELSQQLVGTKNAFRHELLTERLRRMCNIAGQPVPDITLITQDIEKMSLPGVEKFTGGAS